MSKRTLRKLSTWLGTTGLTVPLVMAALVSPAAAQNSSAQDTPGASAKQLQTLVDRGVELRRSGNDDDALQVFEQAERQSSSPSSRLLVHLAAVHQALGDWEEADSYLTSALTRPNDSYISRHRATLDEARRRIDRQIGTLDVRGEPAGAVIYLNGQLRGTLPLDRPLRVTAGVYNMEVRHPDHYTTTRSVALAGGSTTRESLTLAPLTGTEQTPKSFSDGQVSAQDSFRDPQKPQWLAWTFAGLSVASAAGTAVAWRVREKHAERWNDDLRCLVGTASRTEACSGELNDGERAETWMYLGLAATGAFAIGSAVKFLMQDSGPGIEDSAKLRSVDSQALELNCSVGPLSLGCVGRF